MTFDYAAQPKESVKTCNLCGWQAFRLVCSKDRYGLDVQTVSCDGCGLVFINPRMTAPAYGRFYAEGHYRDLLQGRSTKPYAETLDSIQTNYAIWLAWWMQLKMNGRAYKTLLDVGGSTGRTASVIASQHGLDATVMEMSKAEGGRAVARGLKLIEGFIEDYEPNGEQWDVILLCQTIDHLLDITKALGTIRKIIKPGGMFFVDITDYRQKLLRFPVREAIKVDHPYYLTTEHTEVYLSRAGFRVLDRWAGPLFYQMAYLCEPKAVKA